MLTMPAAELSEWEAFFRLEPMPEDREDFRIGQVWTLLANVHRRRGASPFKHKDFMPDFDKPPRKRQTMDEMMAVCKRTGVGRWL